MKIVLTGSLGHISKPLAQELVQKGHTVTVITSNPERQKDIEAIGATAAVGSVEDVDFLTAAFIGADAVYTMLPPPANFHNTDFMGFTQVISSNYAKAIQQAGVKRVVHLSSIGGHTDKGNGILAFHHQAESILNQLPADVAIKFMRPVGFYYNMFAFIPTIKSQGAIVSNYGGDDKEPWVAPTDIAVVIAEEMDTPFSGRTFRYIASDEVSPNELAGILGSAIGKPDLKWLVITDEQILNGMIGFGMNPVTAKGFMEMNASRRGGKLYEDYDRHKPTVMGKVKIAGFAKDFAAAYNQM